MLIDTNYIVSMTEANQNFSHVARLVDENGYAVIMKNNKPRYLILTFNDAAVGHTASNEEVLRAYKEVIDKHRKAFEELAK